LDEKELIQQSKAGNKSAMNTLLKDNYKLVYGYVLKMTGNIQLAEDIVQETMFKAMVNLEKFKPEAKFSTWLVTIATNQYRDMLRKKKRFAEIEDIDIDQIYTNKNRNSIESLAGDSASCMDGIEEQVISKFTVKRVIDILMKLSYEKRASFILKNYYGYKYEEIAQILECPIGTVRSRIHYCVEHILKEFERGEV
jgi:RNA polymerase sigma-70 factor, ECF subfamily